MKEALKIRAFVPRFFLVCTVAALSLNAQNVTKSDWIKSNDPMVSYQLATNGNPKTGVTRVTFRNDYNNDKCITFKYKAKTGDTMYTDFMVVPTKGTAQSADPAYGQDFTVEVVASDMSAPNKCP